MFKVLVCGGRNYNNDQLLYTILDHMYDEYGLLGPIVIIHGGARGADTLGDQWAKDRQIPIEEFKAEWDIYGKSAGYIRNKRMLVEGKPNLVIAFPGGAGTQNMINLAKASAVEVWTIDEKEA